MKKFLTLLAIPFLQVQLYAQPVAEFTWCPAFDSSMQACCIQFENLSVDSGGSITSSLWNFGDGTVSSLHEPQHCYLFIGTYFVNLFVSGTSGIDTVTYAITITSMDTTGCNCDSLIGVNEHNPVNYTVILSPNPFRESAKLVWKGKTNAAGDSHHVDMRIYNSQGVLVRTERFKRYEENEIILERKNLGIGIYTFEISDEAKFQPVRGRFAIE